jgi:hypothetical protein
LKRLKKKHKRPIEAGHFDIAAEWEERDVLPEDESGRGLTETQTWIAKFQPDGTMTIELIQGLADFPRRTPKSSVFFKMVCCLRMYLIE